MAKLPKMEITINHIMEDSLINQEYRSYIGYSGLGHECMRKVWYDFRWVKSRSIQPRIQRIFDRGNWEEERVFASLIDKGVIVSQKQIEVIGPARHVKGHIDATLLGVPTAEKTWHLFEGKTMKDSKFKQYLKLGLKKFEPAYWQQIHSYMGKLNLTRCLYVVTNKDTEERDYQRIKFDSDQYEEGEKRGFYILTSEGPPEKVNLATSTYTICKFCNYSNICHKKAPVDKNCRTCTHWDIEENGAFSCSKKNQFITKEGQLTMKLCGGQEYKLDEVYT